MATPRSLPRLALARFIVVLVVREFLRATTMQLSVESFVLCLELGDLGSVLGLELCNLGSVFRLESRNPALELLKLRSGLTAFSGETRELGTEFLDQFRCLGSLGLTRPRPKKLTRLLEQP